MKRYKRNKGDKQEPTKEEISKYKDFGKLSHKFEKMTRRPKRPLYKDPKIFIALVLIALVAWLIAENLSKDEDQKNDRIEQEQTDPSRN